MVRQDREVGGEAAPVCRQTLAVGQTALEQHGLQAGVLVGVGRPAASNLHHSRTQPGREDG